MSGTEKVHKGNIAVVWFNGGHAMTLEDRARAAMAQTDGVDAVISFDEFIRHLRAAVADEREACAQITETVYGIESDIVVAIRARGNTT